MPIYAYRCSAGHKFEERRSYGDSIVLCGCGLDAERQAVNHVAVIGQAGVPRDERNYRHTFSEYREAVAEVQDGYERVNQARAPSEQIKEPDYFGVAKKRAVAHGAPIRKDAL